MSFYTDTDHRYLHDAEFRQAVELLRRLAEEHGFTPGELKQIAFKAAVELEMRRQPKMVRCPECGETMPAGPVGFKVSCNPDGNGGRYHGWSDGRAHSPEPTNESEGE